MKKIILLSVVLLPMQNVNVFGQIIFSKTINAGTRTEGKSIVQTNDGGYVIAGTIKNAVTDSNDVYLVKTSATGNVLWSKRYGGTGDEKTDKIEKTTDGGFVICGLTNSFGAGGYDVYVIKTDSAGNTLWTKTYGGVNEDGNSSFQNEPYLSFIKQTNDGGYIISSATKSFGSGQLAIYVIKTTFNGDTIWTRTFSNSECLGGAVLQTTDGGYIISASTNDTSNVSSHFYIQCLIKLDALGNLQWTKGIAGDWCAAENAFNGNSIFTTSDGGYALIGNSYDGSCAGNTYYIIKVDSSGNWIWSKDYFHGDYAMTFGGDGFETSDGSFIIPSMSFFVDTINGFSYKAILHKIDNSGIEI